MGPQHRSDAMKKGVGDRLAAGGAGRRREDGPDAPKKSELDPEARAAEDWQPGAPPRGRGLRPQPSRRGGRGGIAGRLRALPDLRQGKAVCEAEAAPQKPLRTLVAGAQCCSSNALRFWSPPFRLEWEDPARHVTIQASHVTRSPQAPGVGREGLGGLVTLAMGCWVQRLAARGVCPQMP